VHRGESNLGFVGNVNRGFALSRNDVVLLNSDTEVTPGWLERMQRCLASDETLGVVSPLSNNATILSVPVMNEDNLLPADMTPDDFADLVARASRRRYPRIPTAVGFCMLIRRQTLDRLGPFDTAFGQGYGEECDFCMRAWQAGIGVAACDDAYVHHYGEASFGVDGKMSERRQRSQRLLDVFWPQYHRAVFAFCHTNPLREVQERIATALAAREAQTGNPEPHILQVMHSYDTAGGTELHTRQLVTRLRRRFRSTVFFPDSQPGVWSDMTVEMRVSGERVVRLCRENVRSNEFLVQQPAALEGAIVESNFARLLAGSDIDVVHFQHLTGYGTLHMPFIAKALGKRVVLTMHDYYLMCPEYNLIHPNMTRCGKAMASEHDEDCFRCLGSKRFVKDESRSVMLHEYLAERRMLMRRIVDEVDAIVAPSSFVRDQVRRAFGERAAEKVRVIPHGVDVDRPSPRPEPAAVLRVGFLGNMSDRKGAHVLLAAASEMRDQPVRFQVFGGVPPAFIRPAQREGLILRGTYEPEQLPELLSEVDVVVIPSIWDETYCLTVSEAQAMGVPVVAADVGAIAERVVDGHTGFLVPAGDPRALAEKLQAIAADPTVLEPVISTLGNIRMKSVTENVEDYASLYAELIARRHQYRGMVPAMLGFAADESGTSDVSRETESAGDGAQLAA
jgi:glycosyltransferase involved in cell wall biosynthesis